LSGSSKTQNSGENMFCILPNELYKFSYQIVSYKINNNENECIPIYSFELHHTTPSTDMFPLTEEHDQTQNNILELHSLSSHSSYINEFDVGTYISH